MHVRDMVEVAGLVAISGPRIIRARTSFSPSRLEQYWASSKCRFESWRRALASSATSGAAGPARDFDKTVELRATLDEILVGEVLARVFSAVVVGNDRMRKASVNEPIARSVMASHMEARRRALDILLHREELGPRQAIAIDRLRRRAERWTDVLIGGLLAECDVREFAVEVDRALDFARDLAERGAPGGRQAMRLVIASLRGAFGRDLCPTAANPEANARITASILGCIPGDLADLGGAFPSLWMTRLAAVASEAEGMIDELLGGGFPPGSTTPSGVPLGRTR